MATARPSAIVCDVGAISADIHSIDALARLQLAARRLELELRLRNGSRDLLDLIAFAGLRDVLRVEMGGQPEQREEHVGVEEKGELDDPAC